MIILPGNEKHIFSKKTLKDYKRQRILLCSSCQKRRIWKDGGLRKLCKKCYMGVTTYDDYVINILENNFGDNY